MAIQFVNEAQLNEKLGKGYQVVNAFATWCGPCKMMAPGLEELSNTTEVFKVDIDESREYAQKMGIQGVPTTFIYKDGQLLDTLVGFQPKEVIEAKLK